MDKNLEQHFSQEIEMACSQLYNAAIDAAKLHDMVKDVDHLEAWQQSKITKAGDYLSSVINSLGHDIAMDKMDIDHSLNYDPTDKKVPIDEKSEGLWANIHAKRERIKRGSGERMRKPNSPGAPTKDSFKKAQATSKNESITVSNYGTKEYERLLSMLDNYKDLYNKAMSHGPLDLSKINDYHLTILDILKTLKQFKRTQNPVDEDTNTIDKNSTYESRFNSKLSKFLEGSMGGINVSHPAVDVSYEKTLDPGYESDTEKHAEKKKMRQKGKKFANQIAKDKQEIEYDEKLNEYLNTSLTFNEDYAEETPSSLLLEDMYLEITGNKNSRYISEDEITIDCEEICGILEEGIINEAEYGGRKVQLNKPVRSSNGPKKFHVFVKNKKGNIIKVNFGDPNMKIKKSNPERRKSFRARHKCDQKKDKTTAGYWSCRAW